MRGGGGGGERESLASEGGGEKAFGVCDRESSVCVCEREREREYALETVNVTQNTFVALLFLDPHKTFRF